MRNLTCRAFSSLAALAISGVVSFAEAAVPTPAPGVKPLPDLVCSINGKKADGSPLANGDHLKEGSGTIQIFISNTGNAAASDFHVKAEAFKNNKYDPELSKGFDVKRKISPGEPPFEVATPGITVAAQEGKLFTLMLKVTVDDTAKVPESREDNNVCTYRVQVGR